MRCLNVIKIGTGHVTCMRICAVCFSTSRGRPSALALQWLLSGLYVVFRRLLFWNPKNVYYQTRASTMYFKRCSLCSSVN